MALARDWTAVRAKLLLEGECRVCGSRENVQAAHTIGRKYDGPVVDPDDIVPLCIEHHAAFDAHELNLLPHTTYAEQGAAVKHVGIDRALKRLTSSHNVIVRRT
jgi:hypothetical protein